MKQAERVVVRPKEFNIRKHDADKARELLLDIKMQFASFLLGDR